MKIMAKTFGVMALGILIILAQVLQPVQARIAAASSAANPCACCEKCTCCLKPGAPVPVTPPLSVPPSAPAQEFAWAFASLISAGDLSPTLLDAGLCLINFSAFPAIAKVAIYQRDCAFLI